MRINASAPPNCPPAVGKVPWLPGRCIGTTFASPCQHFPCDRLFLLTSAHEPFFQPEYRVCRLRHMLVQRFDRSPLQNTGSQYWYLVDEPCGPLKRSQTVGTHHTLCYYVIKSTRMRNLGDTLGMTSTRIHLQEVKLQEFIRYRTSIREGCE